MTFGALYLSTVTPKRNYASSATRAWRLRCRDLLHRNKVCRA